MREYGQIQSSYWGDADVQTLSDFGKLLGAYLLTSPHSNGIGCFRIPLGYVSEDFGKDSETVQKGFDELFRIGFLWRCETTNFVLIRNFLKWNPISNPNVAKSRQKEFDVIPKKFKYFKELCEELLKHGSHFEEPYRKHFETLSKQDPTLPNPIQTLSNPEKRGRFAPPTVEEVQEYISEKSYSYVDAERFVSFYGSKGWKVGKNKMEDWRQALAGWNARERKKIGGSETDDYLARMKTGAVI